MVYYLTPTICLNGHVVSSRSENYSKFCKSCGNSTISHCPSCSKSIQGHYEVPGVFGFFDYIPPSYCHECGEPYPWTSQVINNAVELLALDEQLPSDQKEIIRLALPDLLIETSTTPVAVAKHKKYIPSAQSFVKDGLKNLLFDIVNETVKKSLWN